MAMWCFDIGVERAARRAEGGPKVVRAGENKNSLVQDGAGLCSNRSNIARQ